MPQSALYGQPPATDDDYWIVKALLDTMGKFEANPADGLGMPQLPSPPPDNRSGAMIAGLVISIFLIVTITGARVIARKMMSTSSLGWDDVLIVIAAVSLHETLAVSQTFHLPAQVAAVVWFSLSGAMISQGGAGQHLFNVTYIQFYWLERFRIPVQIQNSNNDLQSTSMATVPPLSSTLFPASPNSLSSFSTSVSQA